MVMGRQLSCLLARPLVALHDVTGADPSHPKRVVRFASPESQINRLASKFL
jgi:hypothetical protein